MESVKTTSWDGSHYNLWFKAILFDKKDKGISWWNKTTLPLKMTIKIKKIDKSKTDLIKYIDCSI